MEPESWGSWPKMILEREVKDITGGSHSTCENIEVVSSPHPSHTLRGQVIILTDEEIKSQRG